MGLLEFNKASVTGALILSLASTPVYSQNLPRNVVPDTGKRYCEGAVTGLDGKEMQAVIRSYKDPSIPNLTMIEFGVPSYRFPGDSEKTWPYADPDFVRLGIKGDSFGDDIQDYVYSSKDGNVIGWNPKEKKSDISPGEIASFNSVVAALQKCK